MKEITFEGLAQIKAACAEIINMNTFALEQGQQQMMQNKISKEDFQKLKIESQAQIADADKLYKQANERIIEMANKIFKNNK
jgi:hypothetical protein